MLLHRPRSLQVMSDLASEPLAKITRVALHETVRPVAEKDSIPRPDGSFHFPQSLDPVQKIEMQFESLYSHRTTIDGSLARVAIPLKVVVWVNRIR
jgi:hypothetical protein